MNLLEKLEDLLLQATTEKSHYYTESVLKEAIAYIKSVENNNGMSLKKYEIETAVSAIQTECKAILSTIKK